MIPCDDVFDLLTRPQPSGEESCLPFGDEPAERLALEAHLACCAECRQLADTLAPALSLFHASQPALAESQRRAPVEPKPRLHGRPQGADKLEQASADLFRLAAALLIGMTLGGWCWNSNSASLQHRRAMHLSWNANTRWLSEEVALSLQLANACLQPLKRHEQDANSIAAPHVVPADFRNDRGLRIACCTQCHLVDGIAAGAPVRIAHLASTCQVCHTN